MEEWEIDFGEIFLWEEMAVFEFFAVVDRGTSRLVYLEGQLGYNAETALEAFRRLFEQHGLPKWVRFDRDPRFVGSWSRHSYPSPLIRLLQALGVEAVICPPRRPDMKPFVERLIGTLKHEWLYRLRPKTLAEAREALDSFPTYYHELRPHQGAACQNRTPEEAFPQVSLPQLPRLPEQVDPDAWLGKIQDKAYFRKVTSDGTIQVDRHSYTIGTKYKGQKVLLRPLDKVFRVICDNKVVAMIDIKGIIGVLSLNIVHHCLPPASSYVSERHKMYYLLIVSFSCSALQAYK